jgi:hypothetical protein
MNNSFLAKVPLLFEWLSLELIAPKDPVTSMYGKQTDIIMCGETVPNTTWIASEMDIPRQYKLEQTYGGVLYIDPGHSHIHGTGYAVRVPDSTRRDGCWYKYYFRPDCTPSRK